MSSLVKTFQNRLGIPRGEAVGRIIGLCLLITLALAIVATVFTFFPYSGQVDTVSILPGNHIQVSKILDGEVQVERGQFLQLAENNQTFIALEDEAISYMVKAGGVSYRYEQVAGYNTFRYDLSNQTIKQGMVVREFHRDIFDMIVVFIALPLLVLFLLLVAISRVQARKIGCSDYRNIFENSFWSW